MRTLRSRAIDAGARFIVSPVFRREVIDACHRQDVPAMPGCFTPTEILEAWDAGADIVKVFPATPLGPGYMKDLRAPLPQIKLMPTGGVTIENAGDWIKAGAVAVGVGSALVDNQAIAAAHYHCSKTTRDGSWPMSARPGTPDVQSRHLRRDHAAAQPARLRTVAAVAGAGRDFRRRRSERCRQSCAVRARQLVYDQASEESHRRCRHSRAAR